MRIARQNIRAFEKKDPRIRVRYLKGVGPKKSEILNRLGMDTVEDLLYYLPRRYEDRTRITPIKDLAIGEYQAVKAKVLASGLFSTKRGINIFQIAVSDGTGILYCVWYNQPFLKKKFKQGDIIIFFGKAEKYDKLRMNHPDYEFFSEEKISIHTGRIVPVYPLTEDLSQRYMRFLVHEAVTEFAPSLTETLPTHIRAKRKMADISFAARNIHFPNSFENLERSYKRLVFEEFFMLQLALALKKRTLKDLSPGIRHRPSSELKEDFKKLFPFELTKEQLRAMDEVERDMADTKPMNRLLEGEVGSGKTVVALYALMLTVRNGYQGAVMAPTEILARQHYITLSDMLMPRGVNVRLLVSGIPGEKKARIKEEIETGDTDIVVGTHALIQEGVTFRKLGLAVIDEQHKFGVTQRSILRDKGLNPDILIMTATPIPRTLAMTVYGDLDISVIRELPGERKPIATYWVEEDRRENVYKFIREEIKKGRQAYIVCPRVSEKSESGLKTVLSMYNDFKSGIFPDLEVGLIHGRMSVEEKSEIMKKFKKGAVNILVSSVVIEVGIDVKNASLMVIENADRFGLAQLHQLRGRIGRGPHRSYCILLGDPGTEASARRLAKMTETQDGFEIAEEDLELRGPGEFFGTKQHGLPELRFGNILKDFEIMEDARREALLLIQEDPNLSDKRNWVIKQNLRKRFNYAHNSGRI